MKRFISQLIVLVSIAILAASCQKTPFITMNTPNSFTFTREGGSQSITFSCNYPWSVTPSESWIQVSPSSGAEGGDAVTVKLTCAANTTYDPRSATVTIKVDELTQTISVNQETGLGLIVSPTTLELTNAAQTIEIEVQKNVQYTVAIDDASAAWIKQGGTKALTTDKITFTIAANESYDNREGKIVFKQLDGNLTQTVTIRQSQTNGLFITTPEYNLSNEAHTLSVEVKANVEFAVTSQADWITYVETKSLKASTIVLSIPANESYDNRTGTVLVKQTNGDLSGIITINQKQTDYLTVTPSSFSVSNQAQTVEIEVKDNVSYSVVIPDDAKSWISVFSNTQTKALTDDKVLLSIAQNTTYDDREASVTIKQTDGSLAGTVKITQAYGEGLIVEKTSYEIGQEGGTIEVEVKANVEFDVIINDDWIQHIETKALNSSSIGLIISENNTYYAREGVIEFKQKGGPLSCSINIIQAQLDYVRPEQNEFAIDAFGGQLIINYEANVQVSHSYDCDWITVIKSDSATCSIYLEIAANAQGVRQAEFSLIGGKAVTKVIIKQSALKDGEYLSLDYGKLSESLARVQTDTITTAAIYGRINETDFRALNHLPKLSKLSLAGASCLDNTIPSNAFQDNETLSTIVFPNDISIIDESAFRNCRNLTLPELPQSLVIINNYAFYGDFQMTGQLNLPSGLHIIGDYAFCSCTGIKGNLSFPEQIEMIGEHSFSGCTGLNGSLTFPTTNSFYVRGYAFNGCRNFTGDLIIPSNLIYNGGYTFNNAGFTGSIYVDVAGWYTFYGCIIGENLIISDEINTLSHSFRGVCVDGYIYIGKSVVSLEGQTFYAAQCNKIYIAAPVPPTCKSNNSIDLTERYLGVPKGCKSAYESAEYWKNASTIEEVDFSDLKLTP